MDEERERERERLDRAVGRTIPDERERERCPQAQQRERTDRVDSGNSCRFDGGIPSHPIYVYFLSCFCYTGCILSSGIQGEDEIWSWDYRYLQGLLGRARLLRYFHASPLLLLLLYQNKEQTVFNLCCNQYTCNPPTKTKKTSSSILRIQSISQSVKEKREAIQPPAQAPYAPTDPATTGA